jgi:hypothetical protein
MYGRSKRPDRAMIGGRAGTNRYRVLDDGKRRNEKQEDGGKLSSRGGLSVKVCEDERVFWVVWEDWLRLRGGVLTR